MALHFKGVLWSYVNLLKMRKGIRNFVELNNKYATSALPCVIIGNGASIKNVNLARLGKFPIFAANAYGIFIEDTLPPPTFYCIADPSYHDEDYHRNHRSFYQALASKCPNTILISSQETLLVATRYARFRKLYSLAMRSDQLLATCEFSVDYLLSNGMPGVQSVSQMMIMMALLMGFRTIYLVGMDHDWLVNYGTSKGDAPHFYLPDPKDNITGVSELQVHNLLIKPLEQNAQKPSFYEEILSHKKLWEGYIRLARYAQNNGITIINSTDGGYLDVFPRAPLPL